ncbi:MAG: hypothetical protein LUH82_07905 [Clostridiales bacterium]|nr:hypothetical protein [Clostridiales bacterium]
MKFREEFGASVWIDGSGYGGTCVLNSTDYDMPDTEAKKYIDNILSMDKEQLAHRMWECEIWDSPLYSVTTDTELWFSFWVCNDDADDEEIDEISIFAREVADILDLDDYLKQKWEELKQESEHKWDELKHKWEEFDLDM